MSNCSVTKHLEIVRGGLSEYRQLSHFHYRDSKMGPYVAIFAMKDTRVIRSHFDDVVGVIVYSMPTCGLELRGVATGKLFEGFDRSTRLEQINKKIRCIRRVIIEPRYRGLGLAARLVRQTMPKLGVPIIESLAVMGRVNPFFEKAGMKMYSAVMPAHTLRLKEALSMVGIEEREFVDPAAVQHKLDYLGQSESGFIEGEILDFIQNYGKRRLMERGLERTRFVLSKLNFRPVYYIWFNPAAMGEISIL
ncbi:MAG: hypothetical protein ABIG61_06250 [Planctomycetota bacterium]